MKTKTSFSNFKKKFSSVKKILLSMSEKILSNDITDTMLRVSKSIAIKDKKQKIPENFFFVYYVKLSICILKF